MRVAVVGAKGQLGAAVVAEGAGRWDLLPFTRDDFDITDEAAVRAALTRARPDVVVNCTAFNDVDGAEDRPDVAMAVNADAVASMARLASELDAVFVHYGTDFVFDGLARAPYRETDAANPQSAYARSKHAGEQAALDVERSYVLRLASVFGWTPLGPAPRGSVATIVANARNRKPIRAFDDRTVTPTSIVDCAWATGQLIEQGAPFGLYHCVSSGLCTWFELAQEAARLVGVGADIVPVHVRDVALKAPRPQFCALSNAKLASVGIVLPRWQDSLRAFVTSTAALQA